MASSIPIQLFQVMPTTPHEEGYWGAVTGNPDWCEENYVVTYYIAEFWNTLSSVPIVLAGLYGLRQSIQQRFGWQYSLSWFALAVVGLGSCAFHGTLLFEGQALDELSMIWCGKCWLKSIRTRTPLTPHNLQPPPPPQNSCHLPRCVAKTSSHHLCCLRSLPPRVHLLLLRRY